MVGAVAFTEVVQGSFDDIGAEVRRIWYGIQFSGGHEVNFVQMQFQPIKEEAEEDYS